MNRLITVLLPLCLLTPGGAVQQKKHARQEQFVVEKFNFDWFVAEAGEAKLMVNKTHETTRIVIIEGGLSGDILWLVPEEAESVGNALADTDRYFASMRNAEFDTSKELDAGRYTVRFHFSKEHGFSVTVAKKERFGGRSILLARETANAFRPHLLKATSMASFIDNRIRV